jgi:signal transduction histidine kinase/CheY-like chemotaxis protein
MSSEAAQVRTSWLQPERNWKGTRALVPVETCYRILDLFLWVSFIVGALGLALGYYRSAELLARNPLFWTVVTMQVPVLLAAICRGWPFNLRYACMAFAMLCYDLTVSMVLGVTPNVIFFSIVLLSTTSLFHGVRAGMTLVVGLMLAQTAIAWGWIAGHLPLFMPSAKATQTFTDFTEPVVWVRVLVIGALMQGGLVVLMRYVLSDLNNALRQSNSTLHKLAVEQEYRARAEEARLKAELAVRESQKFDALGRMASGVAHDFNNALCVMKGWSSLLLEDTQDPLVRDAMSDIKRATDNAAQLTHHLLAFSRNDPAKREVANLAEMVQLETKTLRRLLPPDIEVTAEVAGPVHVRLGRGQLQEIVLNLAINARDAMPQGGRLSFRVRTLETAGPSGQPAGRYARLDVTDTGSGMDQATQARIFEPFFTTKGPGKGTGLGLPMVYGLVSGAGGWIDVDSAPGRGATFTLHLPAVAATDIHIPPPLTAIPTPTRCRVLVVDRQPEIRALVERILTREGFPVIAVANGSEALAALDGPAGRFGLLITEGILPGVSTMEVIERALLVDPDCRVVIASANLPDEIVQRGVEAGTYIPLAKPFDTSQLREAVNEAVGRKSGVTPAAGAA